MKRVLQYITFVLSGIVLIIGCSSEMSDPVTTTGGIFETDMIFEMEVDASQTNRQVWGVWNAVFDTDNLTVSVEPARDVSRHYDITTMIPDPEIFVNSYDPYDEVIDVEVRIFNDKGLHGWDVRLIIFNHSGHDLINSDNWTPLHNENEEERINPFREYSDSDDSRIFRSGSTNTRQLLIHLPDGDTAVPFAIDASYPSNCEEPYSIEVQTPVYVPKDPRDAGEILVKVKAHQGEEVHLVAFGCYDISPFPVFLEYDSQTDLWKGLISVEDDSIEEGPYTAQVRAYTRNSGNLFLAEIFEIEVTDNVLVGPNRVKEYSESLEEYTVNIIPEPGTTYKWSVIPEGAGIFSDPESLDTRFEPAGVHSDTDVIIKVEVTPPSGLTPDTYTKKVDVLDVITTTPNLKEIRYMPVSLEDIHEDQFTFAHDGNHGISENDFIMGEADAERNYGYLRKVDRILSDDGTTLVVSTAEASVSDVLESGHLNTSLNFDFDPSRGGGAVTRHGAGLIKSEYEFLPLEIDFYDFLPRGQYEDFNNDLHEFGILWEEYPVTIGLKEAKATFRSKVNVDLDVGFFEINSFEFSSEGNIILELNAIGILEGQYSDGDEFDLLPTHYYPFMLGPFPSVLEIKFLAGYQFDAEGSGYMTTGVEDSYFAHAGFKYFDGGVGAYFDTGRYDQPAWHSPKGQFNAGANLTCYVKPEISIKVCGMAGPGLDVKPYIELDSDAYYHAENNWCFDYDLFVGIVSDAFVRMSFLDKTIVDLTHELFHLRWDACDEPAFHLECSRIGPCGGVPPEVKINSCPSDPDERESITFTWEMSDDETAEGDLLVSVWEKTDKKVLDPGTKSHTWTNIPYGANTFKVEVTDDYNPPLTSHSSCTWNRPEDPCNPDEDPPDTFITSGCYDRPAGTTQVTLGVSGSDPNNCTPPSNLQFSWRNRKNSGPWSSWSNYSTGNSVTMTGLSAGTWDVEVRARDSALNVDPTPATCRFVIHDHDPCNPDEDPPDTFITSGCYDRPAGTTQVTLGVSGSDPNNCTSPSNLQFSWRNRKNSGPWSSWSNYSTGNSVTMTGLSAGTWDVEVRARDSALNVDPTPATCRFVIADPCQGDTDPPNITLVYPPLSYQKPCISLSDSRLTFNCSTGYFTYKFRINASDPNGVKRIRLKIGNLDETKWFSPPYNTSETAEFDWVFRPSDTSYFVWDMTVWSEDGCSNTGSISRDVFTIFFPGWPSGQWGNPACRQSYWYGNCKFTVGDEDWIVDAGCRAKQFDCTYGSCVYHDGTDYGWTIWQPYLLESRFNPDNLTHLRIDFYTTADNTKWKVGRWVNSTWGGRWTWRTGVSGSWHRWSWTVPTSDWTWYDHGSTYSARTSILVDETNWDGVHGKAVGYYFER